MVATLDIKQATLPTLDRLQAKVPDALDAPEIATSWFKAFAEGIETANIPGVLDLFLEDAFWRDILALTWDFRTFYGVPNVHKFLNDRLKATGLSNLKLDVASAALQTPYPDLAWIQAFFTFDTRVGHGSGVVRIVPTANGAWKAHAISTYLEDLHGHPESTGPLREQEPNHGKWPDKRQREINCEGQENQPKAVIIGGGQSGLEIAARLKYLGVKALVVEKLPRVGNLWRVRYEALCLHDTVWYDHMPYLPFPPTWPDLCDHGVDVTMFQRSPTYVMSTKYGGKIIFGSLYHEGGAPPDVADRIDASFPNYLRKLVHQRFVKDIAELDKDTLEGLERVGFKLGWGIDRSGFSLLAWDKAGGYYFDVGASQLIIDGKIKLKNDSLISRFTKTGLEFENGSTLDADVVVFATGYGDAREPLRAVLGDEVGDRLNRIWGLNSEGEIYGAWRDMGVPRLYVMMGNLALCRFHSKHLALQIKAIEEDVFDGQRYSVEA
ncbi:FAD/NAD(P)-binding domain-containing protein [Auriscalpium vulgare]|uniref:FAD/NAD(P)-binding domain-containing protein n=1 Tax=Auriscalpium vulgare TaxID=40419 RepID=A0ACB8RI64_9AGAM|nr:FAD/NAD(P)-binding domain-containing protein [Auriscalpium vulgare]